MLELKGPHIDLYIEEGLRLGPVREVTVPDLAAAKARPVEAGCQRVKDGPQYPRCHVQDPQGLLYNLAQG